MEDSELLRLWTFRPDDKFLTVYASGEIDIATAPTLLNKIKEAAKDVSVVILNCEQVTYIDSEAIKVFMQIVEYLSSLNKRFILEDCSRQVERTLQLLGLTHLFVHTSDPTAE